MDIQFNFKTNKSIKNVSCLTFPYNSGLGHTMVWLYFYFYKEKTHSSGKQKCSSSVWLFLAGLLVFTSASVCLGHVVRRPLGADQLWGTGEFYFWRLWCWGPSPGHPVSLVDTRYQLTFSTVHFQPPEGRGSHWKPQNLLELEWDSPVS